MVAKVQQSATQQLLQGVKDTDQNFGRLKSKISSLESNDDFLRKKSARMATYLEDPVWQRVQEDITRREYGKIQARERSQRLELHWNREFELLKPKVEDAMVKALTVQRKLIEQLGGVCGSIFPRLLYVYGEQWTESLSRGILTGRQPLSREIQKYKL